MLSNVARRAGKNLRRVIATQACPGKLPTRRSVSHSKRKNQILIYFLKTNAFDTARHSRLAKLWRASRWCVAGSLLRRTTLESAIAAEFYASLHFPPGIKSIFPPRNRYLEKTQHITPESLSWSPVSGDRCGHQRDFSPCLRFPHQPNVLLNGTTTLYPKESFFITKKMRMFGDHFS
jgi:hypothetical protein